MLQLVQLRVKLLAMYKKNLLKSRSPRAEPRKDQITRLFLNKRREPSSVEDSWCFFPYPNNSIYQVKCSILANSSHLNLRHSYITKQNFTKPTLRPQNSTSQPQRISRRSITSKRYKTNMPLCPPFTQLRLFINPAGGKKRKSRTLRSA